MKCMKCSGEVRGYDRICPACGASLIADRDLKRPDEVSNEWLREVLQSEGYAVQVASTTDEAIIAATHPMRPTLFLRRKSNAPYIGVQSPFEMRTPKEEERADLFVALNRSNSENWICTAHVNQAFDRLMVSSFIFIGDRISRRDIADFLDIFDRGIQTVLDRSGVLQFASTGAPGGSRAPS